MFETIITQPILNALVALYTAFTTLGIPGAFGFAIITLTAAIRLALFPFFKQQIESQKKLADLKPKMSDLEKLHKDDKTRLQQAQMDLYKEHGINPASGCLFAIVQIPVFFGLYQTLNSFVTASGNAKLIADINKVLYSPSIAITKLDPTFFMYNLAQAPNAHRLVEFSTKAGFAFQPQNLAYAHYLLIPLITGALQYYQALATLPPTAPKAPSPEPEKKEMTETGDKKASPSFSDDFQQAMNTQMKYFFPLMIAFFSYTLPVGLSLYWNIFSIFSILQSKRKKENAK